MYTLRHGTPEQRAAYMEYVARQERRSRPDVQRSKDGRSFDFLGDEKQPCCEEVEDVSLTAHLRSSIHVAHLFEIDPDAFRRYVSNRRSAEAYLNRRTINAH